MNAADNERGGAALLYVFMVMLLLLAVSPFVLSVISNEANHGRAESHEMIAVNLAVSGMETFIAYLDTYTSGDRKAFAYSYPGIVSESYSLPDGTPVAYRFRLAASDTPGRIDATVYAAAGSGKRMRSKEITYKIDPSMGMPNPYEDDSLRRPVTDSAAIYEGRREGNLMQEAIGKVIYYFQRQTQRTIEESLSQAAVCFCADASQIRSQALEHGVLYIPQPLAAADFTGTFGSPDHPVVLIFESLRISNEASIEVFGNVLVRGNVFLENGAQLKLNEINGEYGNFMVLGQLAAKNQLAVTGAQLVYAGELTFENHAEISSGTLVAAHRLTAKNNTNLRIDQDFIAGSINLKNNTELTAVSGDVLVQNDLVSKHQLNLIAGGVIAAGGRLMAEKHDVLRTGGGTTAFPIITNPGWNPLDVSGEHWNPIRK